MDSMAATDFGEVRPSEFVPGTELLSLYNETVGLTSADAGPAIASSPEMNSESDLADGSIDQGNGLDDDGLVESDSELIAADDEPDNEDESNPKGDDDTGDVVVDKLTKAERVSRAVELSQTRPLTQDDFERIKMLQMERKLLPSGGLKRARITDESREEKLSVDDILPDMKRSKMTKEERLQSVMEGREGRGKYVSLLVCLTLMHTAHAARGIPNVWPA